MVGNDEHGAKKGLLASNVVADFLYDIFGSTGALINDIHHEDRGNRHEQREETYHEQLHAHGSRPIAD